MMLSRALGTHQAMAIRAAGLGPDRSKIIHWWGNVILLEEIQAIANLLRRVVLTLPRQPNDTRSAELG
jgi:hypothetical protein